MIDSRNPEGYDKDSGFCGLGFYDLGFCGPGFCDSGFYASGFYGMVAGKKRQKS